MKKIIFSLLVVGCLIYFWRSYYSWHHATFFRLVFFDIGQGDSILIVTPKGQTILIDGGPDASVLKELGQVLPFWLRHLDLIVLTHVHDDHLAGLVSVLYRYKTNYVLLGDYNNKSSLVVAWQEILTKTHSSVIAATTGQIINFSDGCFIKILSAAHNQNDENDNSLVAMFSCLNRNILLTGDAGYKIEENLKLPEVDILKVAHHGSDTGNSQSFLKAVKPKLAVISVGQNNKFNHPNPIILKRLSDLAINVLRTDQFGNLYFLANSSLIIWKKQ